MTTDQPLTFYGTPFTSRLLIGTALYPSPDMLSQSVKASGAGIVTVSLRREAARAKTRPAVLGADPRRSACACCPTPPAAAPRKEAITTAEMARELFGTDWIKLEVIANDDTLQPDLFGLVEAAAHAGQATASRCSPTPPRTSAPPSGCWRPAARC